MQPIIISTASSGSVVTQALGTGFERGYISVDFYDDGSYSNIVTPTAGTVTLTASRNNLSYASISNGTVSAKLTGANGTYSWPTFAGPVAYIKATFSSVTGATHAKIYIDKYKG